jgi:acyl-CoA synthetase (AMP-forming)/AMP-acid ligase II
LSRRGATVGDLVELGARRSPDRAALKVRDGRQITYAELDQRSNRLANALLGSGLERGDRVAAWMTDRIEYVELYLAVAKAGMVMVPINAMLRAKEAAHPLADSGARALFCSTGTAGSPEELPGLSELQLLAAVGDEEPPGSWRYEEDLVALGSPRRPAPPDPDSPYVIGYTSGTTGAPKGAVLTHRSVLAIARLNALSYRLPLFSVAAATGSMSFVATVPAHYVSHLYVGGTVVMMGRWDVESLLATVAAERVTFTYLPAPTIPQFTDLGRADPGSWATLTSILHSASRADPAKLRELCEVVGGRFVEGLGMTENSGGLVTATTSEDVEGETEARDLFASTGRAVAESAVALVGPEGEPLPHDGETVGELAIRTPALMSGYWNRPEETERVLRDGWYRTGDLASIDPAGYVYVADRRTDLIVSGGINVYPTEVEDVIRAIPGVEDCAVVGLPHERWGQTVVAAVTLNGSEQLDAAAVIEHCRGELASFKKPTEVAFVEELPRTTSLKVRRSAVRDMLVSQLRTKHSVEAAIRPPDQ